MLSSNRDSSPTPTGKPIIKRYQNIALTLIHKVADYDHSAGDDAEQHRYRREIME
jgi:hypothetical protein